MGTMDLEMMENLQKSFIIIIESANKLIILIQKHFTFITVLKYAK